MWNLPKIFLGTFENVGPGYIYTKNNMTLAFSAIMWRIDVWMGVWYTAISWHQLQNSRYTKTAHYTITTPPASYASHRPFCFTAVVSFFLFSLPNLRNCLADRHQTLPYVWCSTYKIRSEIWVPPQKKFGSPKTSKFWHDFVQLHAWSARSSHEVWRFQVTGDIFNRSEKGVANYGQSHTGRLILVYFSPQMAKNRTRVLTDQTRGHQAGHCQASNINKTMLQPRHSA